MGYNKIPRVKYNCDFCGIEQTEQKSKYERSIKHFCNMKCYKSYVKTLDFNKQNSYKGVRRVGDTKQVYHRRYSKNHPLTISHLKARRYAREKGAIGSHTLEEWLLLKEKFNNLCANCHLSKVLTKDHIVPLALGGTDYIDNIQPLCRNCNSQKWMSFNIYENPVLAKSKEN